MIYFHTIMNLNLWLSFKHSLIGLLKTIIVDI